MGGFAGGNNPNLGVSKNASERDQRVNEQRNRIGFNTELGAQDLFRYLVSGGPFEQTEMRFGNGQQAAGAFDRLPSGPVFNLINQGLESEQGLSQLRQSIANQLLGNTGQDFGAARNFGLQQLAYGQRAMPSQEQLFQQQFGAYQGNEGIQDRLFGSLGNYMDSGGAPTDFQRNTIGDIYNAQRDIAHSNLTKGYQDVLRGLQDHATSRGLRFNDTPIQDRGGLLAQEFVRNAANIESSLGGQQAGALLEMPFRQNQVNLGALGQIQNSNLNTLNAFSIPINNAFNQQQGINSFGQFGLQFAPSAFSGAPLQNMAAILRGDTFANGVSAFSPTQRNPTLGETFGQNFGAFAGRSLGSQLGGAAGNGIISGLGG